MRLGSEIAIERPAASFTLMPAPPAPIAPRAAAAKTRPSRTTFFLIAV
jgi:hypothetical protein